MMIVPTYWAEARLQDKHKGRTVTVRRFGWSDESPAAAQVHAEARTREALDAIQHGRNQPRRERRSNYGVEGAPIREQIVQRSGESIITRNSYGALCLNSRDVLFADIDHTPPTPGCALTLLSALGLLLVGLVAGILLGNWVIGLVLGAMLVLLVNAALLVRRKQRLAAQGGPEGIALARVAAFCEKHPDWHLRVYRTPAGLRVLVMHTTFSPHDEAVQRFFETLGTDALYARMCRLQHCFRARLTAKPWRAGITQRITPPVAAWSAEHATLPTRLAWITDYEQRAAGFAACAYLRSFGDVQRIDAKAEYVRELHDRLSRAQEALPLA